MKRLRLFSVMLLLIPHALEFSSIRASALSIEENTANFKVEDRELSKSQLDFTSYNQSGILQPDHYVSDNDLEEPQLDDLTEESSDEVTPDDSKEETPSIGIDRSDETSKNEKPDTAIEFDKPSLVRTFDSESEYSVAVSSEAHFRAVLLGETFQVDGESIDYGTMDDQALIEIELTANIQLTEPIVGISREQLYITSQSDKRELAQTSSETFLGFEQIKRLKISNIRLNNLLSQNGLFQLQNGSEVEFADTDFQLNSLTARIFYNTEADVVFSGNTNVTTLDNNDAASTAIVANSVSMAGDFKANIRTGGTSAFIETNQLTLGEDIIFLLERSRNSNTGAVVNLIGSEARLFIADNSVVTVKQSGMFVAVGHSAYDNQMVIGKSAKLDLSLGQGLSGTGNNTIGAIYMDQDSQLVLNEYGTVTDNPRINVGRSFITEDAEEHQKVIIESTRTSAGTAPFIFLRAVDSAAVLGESTQAKITQQGPMFTGVATTTLTISDHVQINNTHSNGFSGNTAVQAIRIGNHVRLTINEPSNAVQNVAYRTFFAQNLVEIGNHTNITVPRTRTNSSASTSNVLIGLSANNGRVVVGEHTEINVNQRGGFVNANLGNIQLGKSAKLLGTLGHGITAGTRVDQFIIEEDAEINIQGHSTSSDVPAFSVQSLFFLGEEARITYNRNTTGAAAFIALGSSSGASRFLSEAKAQIKLDQVGPFVTGRSTTDVYVGESNIYNLTVAQGFTGGTGSSASSTIRRLQVGDGSEITIKGRANANVDFFRFREEILLGKETDITVEQTVRNDRRAIFRLASANSTFTVGGKLNIDTGGRFLQGVSTTDLVFGTDSNARINAARGVTGATTIRSVTLDKGAQLHLTEPLDSNLRPSASNNVQRIMVSQRVELLDNAILTSRRDRTTSDSRLIQLTGANSFVRIGKGALFDVDQSGGIFAVQTTSNLILDEEATFQGVARGLNTWGGGNNNNSHNNSFANITVGPRAIFSLTDDRSGIGTASQFSNRPLVNVRNSFTAMEDSTVYLETTINKNEVMYFRRPNAQLNVQNVQLFEINHPSTRTGQSNNNLQRLIRSAEYSVNNGLRINVSNQKFSVWENRTTAVPTEEFINISGVMRINRNGGQTFPYGGTGNREARSRLLTGESLSGSLESRDKENDIYEVIAKNNYNRLRFSEPEGLVARVDPLSDQTAVIHGSVYEDADVIEMTYTNTAGETKTITPETIDEAGEPVLQWGEYRDDQEIYRYFTIDLGDQERLETNTEFHVHLSKPSNELYQDADLKREVIKGVDYFASNITLDRHMINKLDSNEDLYALIMEESKSEAVDVLSGADISDTIRVVDTDLSYDTTIDKTYFAELEVGNKAYQFTVGIDVSSLVDQMIVRIPTKIVFESMYEDSEESRAFRSENHQIRNDSAIAVDMKVNRFDVEDDSGIVVLRDGENPLDYAEYGEDEDENEDEDDRELTLEDIRSPLLELDLQFDEKQIRLYERMSEVPVGILAPRSRSTMALNGYFYGDYPEIFEDDDGNEFVENLTPKYQITLRFTPLAE